ncbi:protein kinase domain-containing protein [Actinomadura rudentiformis]|uniref:non-specific serine/threonine protein kinase n=1 Tax=Actinomadura rudentiformis TaxID=359158 RepID=A0A6H9YYI7_9ACTN|nr:protein kinase [Actinomadura rudentiformis]KAB2351593.1 protein kinase [Actinomadura rudentiformis]
MGVMDWRVPGLTEVRELGAGAQGRVVLARRDDSGVTIAVKYLAPALLRNPGAREVFRTEARLLQRVDDVHVARLFAFVEDEGGAAIVMEAVNGVALRRILDEHGVLEPEAAFTVLKGALLGLGAAHRVGVVHRDFKPANVMVERTGNSKLIDFGIAVLAGQGDRSGTPSYMAPEQWLGRPASSATDMYSATCVFFECVTGSRPFGGRDTRTLREQHTTQPPPVDDVPEPLRELVARGLAKNPQDRPSDAAEFVSELETVAVGAYGKDWEGRGLAALAASSVAVAATVPAAAATVGEGAGVLAKLGIGLGSVAAAGTAAAVGAYFMWPTDPSIKHAWTAQSVKPASPVAAVDGGFALYTSDGRGGFEIVGLNGKNGRVRWRHPATPSATVRGVDLYPAAKDRTVVYMSPVGRLQDRRAAIVAVDAATGTTRWSYGTGGVLVDSQPELCANESKICLTQKVSGRTSQQKTLNLSDGRLLTTSTSVDGRRLQSAENGDTLLVSSDGKDLLLIPPTGPTRWRRPLTEVFKSKVNPDNGWWLELKDGRYIGSIGRTDSANFATQTYYYDRAVVAAFDAATGRPLWLDRGASVFCGEIVFELQHPVRCRTKGTQKGERRQGLNVTVEGFDPATGATRWSWNAGDVPALGPYGASGERGVMRLSDTEYLVRTPTQGHTILNLDTGPRPLQGSAPSGWCREHTSVPGIPGVSWPVGQNAYLHQSLWPCTIDRRPVKLPRLAPDFSGTRSGKVYAWADKNTVQAVHVK